MTNLTKKNQWNPWTEMERFFTEAGLPNMRAFERWREEQLQAPACDVEETDAAYLFSLDIPGMRKDDIKVELHDNLLTIRGSRKEERTEATKARHLTERYYGSFERSFTLPSRVHGDRVEAAYENGVLRIAIPKVEASRAREIKIGDVKPGIFTKMSA